MNNYVSSIDTDIGIGSILSNFETAWVMNTVRESLDIRFRPYEGPMPNFVDILNRQFEVLLMDSPDYRDQVLQTRDQTFQEIIEVICGYYNLEFSGNYEEIQPVELYGIARTLYDIFISRFTIYMIDFYVNYVMSNIDPIYAYLNADENVRKPREKDIPVKSYIDPKFLLIHANLNQVILNTAAYDISLENLLSFFVDKNTADRLCSYLDDKGDIYKNYYAIYLKDERYMAELLTSIKLKLQSKTQESFGIK